MSATTHPDCAVCLYWQDRIDSSRVRALQKVEGAFGDERRARQELAAHLARTEHVEGDR